MDGGKAGGRRTFIAGDALRALSVLAILTFHAGLYVALVRGRSPADAYGWLSAPVTRLAPFLFVFFALSGYLVGGPFVRAWLRGGGWPAPGRYLGKRLRRIVPAFWLVLVALYLRYGTGGSSAGAIALVFAFGQNYDHAAGVVAMPQGWTLDIEMLFYGALPLLAWVAVRGRLAERLSARARRRALFVALGAITVLGLVVRLAVHDLEGWQARNLIALGPGFAPGLLLAALEDTAAPALAGTVRGRRMSAGLVLIALAAWLVIVLTTSYDGSAVSEIGSVVLGGAAVGAGLVWQWTTARAPRVVDNAVAHALGRWSYGVYLVHVGVLLTLVHHIPSFLGMTAALAFCVVLSLVISCVLAAALWRFVEQPFIERRSPFGRRPARVAGVEGAVPAAVPPAEQPARAG